MKVWNGYGSEHSSNIVMIGQFKTIAEAEKAKRLMEEMIERLFDLVGYGVDEEPLQRFSDEVMEILIEKNLSFFGPEEMEQFRNEVSIKLDGDKLIFKTEENDYSVFIKMLIREGAKIEIYSAHDHPDEPYGRGK